MKFYSCNCENEAKHNMLAISTQRLCFQTMFCMHSKSNIWINVFLDVTKSNSRSLNNLQWKVLSNHICPHRNVACKGKLTI